jgi:hypothetical protein
MGDKIKVPLHFSVTVEEALNRPANERWRAQFMFYPHGYGRTPADALNKAWRRFESEINPGRRWWSLVQINR